MAAIGIMYVAIVERGYIHPDWRGVLMVGFLGAFTTFSTFSDDVVGLAVRRPLHATAYVVVTIVAGLAAAAAGMALGG